MADDTFVRALPAGGGIVANESQQWTVSILSSGNQYLAVTSCFCFCTYTYDIIML